MNSTAGSRNAHGEDDHERAPAGLPSSFQKVNSLRVKGLGGGDEYKKGNYLRTDVVFEVSYCVMASITSIEFSQTLYSALW